MLQGRYGEEAEVKVRVMFTIISCNINYVTPRPKLHTTIANISKS